MADENPNTPAAPAAAPVTPAIPAEVSPGFPEIPTRATVPAAAVFPDDVEPAAPVKKADETPTPAVPVAPVKKADETATPAVPVAPVKKADETATPAVPAASAKIKIGDKEYSVVELEKALADQNKSKLPATPAAPTAAPVPETKLPTPEEIHQSEVEWKNHFLTESKLDFPMSKEEMEVIIEGGEDAAKLFASKLKDVAASSVLYARKSMYRELNPFFENATSILQPLIAQQQQLERIATEQEFIGSYPEFKGHEDTCRRVAEALIANYPKQVEQMTRQDFLAEVAIQSGRIMQDNFKRYNPAASGSWKDGLKVAAPAPVAVPAVAPVVPAGAPVAAVPAVAPAAPSAEVLPPVANSPAAAGGSPPPANWHQSVAASLEG